MVNIIMVLYIDIDYDMQYLMAYNWMDIQM